jgi:hypothetical protein
MQLFAQKIVFRCKTPDFIDPRVPDRISEIFLGTAARPRSKTDNPAVDNIVAASGNRHSRDPRAQVGRSLGVAFRATNGRRCQYNPNRARGNADDPYSHGAQFTSALLAGSSHPEPDGTVHTHCYHLPQQKVIKEIDSMSWLWLKVVPWSTIISSAPAIVEGARQLLDRRGTGTEAVDMGASDPGTLAHRLRIVELRQQEMLDVIDSLAKSNEQLTEALTYLRSRAVFNFRIAIVLGVIVAVLVISGTIS